MIRAAAREALTFRRLLPHVFDRHSELAPPALHQSAADVRHRHRSACTLRCGHTGLPVGAHLSTKLRTSLAAHRLPQAQPPFLALSAVRLLAARPAAQCVSCGMEGEQWGRWLWPATPLCSRPTRQRLDASCGMDTSVRLDDSCMMHIRRDLVEIRTIPCR